MKSVLDRIESPADLKALGPDELTTLAAEVRELIIETVSDKGGHLASSLGAVEIAIALHHVLDTPHDRIVWDVGHQAYAHKILTGRKDEFRTLRQYGGISGFPKPSESPYDAFVAGHSSTSISAALGMASARDLAGSARKVVAVIGDGSLTAGLAFEGLNQAGHLKKDLIVILNDNEMSISKNVGALSQFLSRKLTGRFAMNLKKEIERFIKTIPRFGTRLLDIARRAEDSIITLLTPGMLFEGLGFHYVGPVDGHDIEALVASLKDVSSVEGPVLLHVLTKKGKGYLPAESDPAAFHGVGPFIRETGKPRKPSKPSYTNVFSSALLDIAASDRRVVAITAAMPEGTGLSRFAERYPDRFFDVGIAEQHALTFAAGLAKEGFVPVTAIYSTFLQRAYDEVFHDVCLQDLPVVIAMDRAGIVGQDGPTHHGLFDIAYLRHLPNMIVAAPRDEDELRHLLYSAVQYGRPVALRYPRGACTGVDASGPMRQIPLGKAEVLKEGKDAAILAIGNMVHPALEAAGRLEKAGVKAGVINARFAKPLDAECILQAASSAGALLTVEESSLQGGFGSAVLELLEERGVHVPVKRLGVPDEFIEHGSQEELRARLGLTAEGIEAAAKALVAGSGKLKMAF
ncbi:MAG: 1-deoxy-D-xylulose-5-phosphate synthase [Deltaproteobacteria bacterium]|nr:1-deoxy-D-xylulose-5-phosphate synthase [Deltaproteobacteria bacterium]MCL4874940.1 1-deoxy-D-xylulose-5-phosphate synthase [bacterium]